jgi:hypothetical protein
MYTKAMQTAGLFNRLMATNNDENVYNVRCIKYAAGGLVVPMWFGGHYKSI